MSRVVVYEQVGDTDVLVLQFEEVGKTRLADVKTHYQHLLAQQREAHSQVSRREGLTLTRCGRGEHDDLLVLLQHELDVRTYRTEYLLHDVVLVLVYHDVCLRLRCLACDSHVADDRQSGEASHILVSFNLVAEEVDEEQYDGRYSQADNQRDEQDDRLLRAYLSERYGVVDELTLVGCSGERDRVLLTLLQEHQVKTRLHLLLSADLVEHTLLLRRRVDHARVAVVLLQYRVALNLCVALHLSHRTANT